MLLKLVQMMLAGQKQTTTVKFLLNFFSLFCRGRISYFTHPPETHTLPTHVNAEIVAEMGKAFDWDELEKGNLEALAGNLVYTCSDIDTTQVL